MPDKKLTDNEIVKAFQMCTLKAEHPGFILCGQIVDLINRLQAENARLKTAQFQFISDINAYKSEILRLQKVIEDKGGLVLIETAKAEVYKECIEKVKELIEKYSVGNGLTQLRNSYVDNLLKELERENSAG